MIMSKKIKNQAQKIERDNRKVAIAVVASLLVLIWGLSFYQYLINNDDINRLVFQPLIELNLVQAVIVFGISIVLIVVFIKWAVKQK